LGGAKRPLRRCTTVRALGTAASSDSRSRRSETPPPPRHSAPLSRRRLLPSPALFSTLRVPARWAHARPLLYILPSRHHSSCFFLRHGNIMEATIDRHGASSIKLSTARVAVCMLRPPSMKDKPSFGVQKWIGGAETDSSPPSPRCERQVVRRWLLHKDLACVSCCYVWSGMFRAS